MQPAFAMLGMLPPPAPSSDVLVGLDGTGARRAADARIAAAMKGIGWYFVPAQVAPQLVVAPFGERIELGQAMLCVEFLDLERAASDRLCAPLPGNPRAARGERPSERGTLANRAAALPQLD